MRFTLAQPVTFAEDIKKSRFETFAAPVASIEQAQQFLSDHLDASTSHQCWAWKIDGQSRINDDGEPQGTAGRPILAVIEGQQLDQVIVLVNRWYGGVKLGTGGLARAYGGSASQCIQLAEKIPLIERKTASFSCDYKLWSSVQYYLDKQVVSYEVTGYADQGLNISCSVTAQQHDDLATFLLNSSKGVISLITLN
jgi:uncharacterized YigZ family protein